MKVSEFDYELPEHLIAQTPSNPRDASRLLVIDRRQRQFHHTSFASLGNYLEQGDVLVANDARVMPARLFARKPTGGRVELLLLQRLANGDWEALAGGRKVQPGLELAILDHYGQPANVSATIVNEGSGALRHLRFDPPVDAWLEDLGYMPLPPYIHSQLEDPARYQTVYARSPGSSAAPTAGLHFTPDLLLALREQGTRFETVTLNVGLDTFQPISAETVSDHHIHSEWARISVEAAQRINQSKLAGGRIVSVGTTSARILETAALRSAGISGSLQTISRRDASGETTNICPWRPVAAFEGHTDLYIHPGYRFRAVDALITNFHLPRSTLLMMVSAFADRELILEAYAAAVAEGYRFYSFGDAMLIL